jgi:hypothetical protein
MVDKSTAVAQCMAIEATFHSRDPLLGKAVPVPKWNDGKVAASTVSRT